MSTGSFHRRRRLMVKRQLMARDICDDSVLAAMASVPRHDFVPPQLRDCAYQDRPLPIGEGQTISQPYIVALMTQWAGLTRTSRVLDVGTGSGYQAAVLASIVDAVQSVEIVPDLATTARDRLRHLGFDNVHVHCDDGDRGWPAMAPYDAIVVAAAPAEIPPQLVDQVATGGRLVIPVGRHAQTLMCLEKGPDGTMMRTAICPVAFVPMTGVVQTRSGGASGGHSQ
ncbi:MAG: protein-L-isoaspartate(D-aspartate) O-methyltransferase [Rubripirellula sp.]